MRVYDAIVIGGGLVGSAIAYGLARAGLHTALLDEGDAAYRASRGNFGLVWVRAKARARRMFPHTLAGAEIIAPKAVLAAGPATLPRPRGSV